MLVVVAMAVVLMVATRAMKVVWSGMRSGNWSGVGSPVTTTPMQQYKCR
jgi:hypothetical protein